MAGEQFANVIRRHWKAWIGNEKNEYHFGTKTSQLLYYNPSFKVNPLCITTEDLKKEGELIFVSHPRFMKKNER